MCALLEFFHQSHNVLLIISKTCQSVWDLALPIAKEMYCRPCVSDVLTSFFTSERQQWFEVESYDTQSEPSLGGVAMETLPLSGLGSFVAVKAYY